jgi:glycerate 2-kinase
MDSNRFLTHSLRGCSQAEHISRILLAAMQAVDPIQAVISTMTISENWLIVGDRDYDLRQYERVILIGFGKASAAMTEGVCDLIGEYITSGAIIAKHIEPDQRARIPQQIAILQGDHPFPGENSLTSSQRLLSELEFTTERDLVICLISGGGSALFTQPQDGIGLEDVQALTRLLLASGAEIGEINVLRKHLDRVKGGGLARLAAPAQLVTLIISDVIGSPLDVIASGTTVPDLSTFQDAMQVLEIYGLTDESPPVITRILQAGLAGDLPETLKPGDSVFARVHNTIIADNFMAAQAAAEPGEFIGLEYNAIDHIPAW